MEVLAWSFLLSLLVAALSIFWQQNNKDAFYDKAVSVKSVRMVA